MRVDREIDFLDRELVRARDDELVDQLRRVRADDVGAEDLAVLRVANDLHEAFGLARRARAAVRREGELADLVVELLVLALLLGEADRRDLGMAVRRVRDVAVVHPVRDACPASSSARTTPSRSPLCASIGGPATSPMA